MIRTWCSNHLLRYSQRSWSFRYESWNENWRRTKFCVSFENSWWFSFVEDWDYKRTWILLRFFVCNKNLIKWSCSFVWIFRRTMDACLLHDWRRRIKVIFKSKKMDVLVAKWIQNFIRVTNQSTHLVLDQLSMSRSLTSVVIWISSGWDDSWCFWRIRTSMSKMNCWRSQICCTWSSIFHFSKRSALL